MSETTNRRFIVNVSYLLIILLLLSLLVISIMQSDRVAEGGVSSQILFLLFMGAFLLIFMSQIVPLRLQPRKEDKIIETLRCNNCGYTETRSFEAGHFVGKIIGKCPKCTGDMGIDLIYLEPAPKPKRLV